MCTIAQRSFSRTYRVRTTDAMRLETVRKVRTVLGRVARALFRRRTVGTV
jgi:hypothetical protein